MSEEHDRPEPLTIAINGQEITADMAMWRQVQGQIQARINADCRAWENDRRASGQVWYALYYRYRSPYVEECFSRRTAEAVMEWDDQSNVGIINPDGSFDVQWFYRNSDPLPYFADVLAEAKAAS